MTNLLKTALSGVRALMVRIQMEYATRPLSFTVLLTDDDVKQMLKRTRLSPAIIEQLVAYFKLYNVDCEIFVAPITNERLFKMTVPDQRYRVLTPDTLHGTTYLPPVFKVGDTVVLCEEGSPSKRVTGEIVEVNGERVNVRMCSWSTPSHVVNLFQVWFVNSGRVLAAALDLGFDDPMLYTLITLEESTLMDGYGIYPPVKYSLL